MKTRNILEGNTIDKPTRKTLHSFFIIVSLFINVSFFFELYLFCPPKGWNILFIPFDRKMIYTVLCLGLILKASKEQWVQSNKMLLIFLLTNKYEEVCVSAKY